MVVPYYAVRLDPEPKNIPSIAEIVPDDFIPGNVTWVRSKYLLFVRPKSVKPFADRIVSQSCEGNKICNAKALFYFVRDNFDYVIFDTAPVNKYADGLVIANLIKNVITITRAKHTSYKSIRDMLRKLSASNANLLGGIINHF